jgi:hypothetical protein
MKIEHTYKNFEKARNYMEKILVDSIQNLEIGIYDPLLKYIFEKELKKVLTREFNKKFPDINVNFCFQVYLSSQMIEYSVQRYYHPYSMHIFLGSIRDAEREKGSNIRPYLVDCYYSSLYETFGEPRIIVRYGHDPKDMIEGGMNAAEEFFRGLSTPLAKGYQLAMEAGYARQ